MEMKKRFFTCIGRGHGAPVRQATREDWQRARREPWLQMQCAKIERLVAEGAGEDIVKGEKARLWVWTPHCAEFREGHRSVADAVEPLPRLMIDFDEKGHTDDIVASLTRLTYKNDDGIDEEVATLGGLVVLLVEESVRRGTHVLVELPEGMTAEKAQRIMAEATGFEPDKAVKDVSRCIYMVPESYTRYVSERLYEPDHDLPLLQAEENLPMSQATAPSHEEEQAGGLLFKGIPYSSIISAYWRRTGGEPVEGERNVKLHKLAVNLRAICDNRRELMMQVMPRYGLSEQELQSIVDSACKEPPKGISKVIQACIEEMAQLSATDGVTVDEEDSEAASGAERGTVNARLLPIGLRESLAGVPGDMQMPVLTSLMPLLMAYADGVEVEYCDGKRQRLACMAIIVGEQASGKSACKDIADLWLQPLRREDAVARQREDEWRERRKGRKANEKAPEDPKVLIREVPVTISCSTLLRRMKYSQGHTLYSFGEELDTLRKTNGAGSWSSKYDIYRMAFDHGIWGQDYNSDQAESGMVTVGYNWSILGTYGALRKCFTRDNIENGLSSRVMVAEMPNGLFAEMPKYCTLPRNAVQEVERAVAWLRAASGFVDTPRLRKAIGQWVEERRLEAARELDRVKDIYRKRAAVIGFRCGVVYYLLAGKETKRCLDFATMMADYVLAGQTALFGPTLLQNYTEAASESKYNCRNSRIFDRLPPTFSLDELAALKGDGFSKPALRTIVWRWNKAGWVEPGTDGRWQKTVQTT